MIDDVQNAVGSRVNVRFNESCTIYKHFSLQIHHIFANTIYSVLNHLNEQGDLFSLGSYRRKLQPYQYLKWHHPPTTYDKIDDWSDTSCFRDVNSPAVCAQQTVCCTDAQGESQTVSSHAPDRPSSNFRYFWATAWRKMMPSVSSPPTNPTNSFDVRRTSASTEE